MEMGRRLEHPGDIVSKARDLLSEVEKISSRIVKKEKRVKAALFETLGGTANGRTGSGHYPSGLGRWSALGRFKKNVERREQKRLTLVRPSEGGCTGEDPPQ